MYPTYTPHVAYVYGQNNSVYTVDLDQTPQNTTSDVMVKGKDGSNPHQLWLDTEILVATWVNVPSDFCYHKQNNPACDSKQSDSRRCRMKTLCIFCYPKWPSEDSDQTARMHKLVWIFAGRTCPLISTHAEAHLATHRTSQQQIVSRLSIERIYNHFNS